MGGRRPAQNAEADAIDDKREGYVFLWADVLKKKILLEC
jgi:hypothetical protein